jgi:hypothetical protein
MIYGYARVSTDGQSVDAQVKQLRAAKASRILRETASGAKSDRAVLGRVVRASVNDEGGFNERSSGLTGTTASAQYHSNRGDAAAILAKQ